MQIFSLCFFAVLLSSAVVAALDAKNGFITDKKRDLETVAEEDEKFEKEIDKAKEEGQTIETGAAKELDDDPLYFIMHIGPPKTGTTSIQCALKKFEVENELPENVVFMPRTNTRAPCDVKNYTIPKTSVVTNKMAKCLTKWDGVSKFGTCWQEYLNYFNKQASNKKHVILSDEKFSFMSRKVRLKGDPKKFFDSWIKMLPSQYKVVFVVTYRKFFDFFNSYYTQVNKFKSKQKWPGKGGYVAMEPKSFHPVVANLTRIIEVFSKSDHASLKLLNMDKGQLMKDFLCDAIPSEMNMCDLADKLNENSTRNTYNGSIWCDQLATAAYKKKLIDIGKRQEVVKAIEDELKINGKSCYDLPSKCPKKGYYEGMWNKTLKIYYGVFPEEQKNKEIETSYRSDFDKDSYKLCAPDTQKALKTDEWKQFFKSKYKVEKKAQKFNQTKQELLNEKKRKEKIPVKPKGGRKGNTKGKRRDRQKNKRKDRKNKKRNKKINKSQ